ncbi:hypothetical protein B0O99DRAFT_748767 [Bisporella sp. PMI_857]|nr:hypothetical protein B0O99DRAFT_748767 [Bisporella sp. PMI_857]
MAEQEMRVMQAEEDIQITRDDIIAPNSNLHYCNPEFWRIIDKPALATGKLYSGPTITETGRCQKVHVYVLKASLTLHHHSGCTPYGLKSGQVFEKTYGKLELWQTGGITPHHITGAPFDFENNTLTLWNRWTILDIVATMCPKLASLGHLADDYNFEDGMITKPELHILHEIEDLASTSLAYLGYEKHRQLIRGGVHAFAQLDDLTGFCAGRGYSTVSVSKLVWLEHKFACRSAFGLKNIRLR